MWKFYAGPMSYFSAKIRPLLRYKRIDYAEIRATPGAYNEVILPRTGVSFIPVIITDDDEVLQDTPRMYERIEELVPGPAIFPADPAVRLVAELIQDFADEALLLPAMHFRWNYPEQRDWIERDWQPVFAEMTPKVMGQMNSFLPFLGVNDDTREVIDAWYDTLLAILDTHLKEHRFLLGDTPTLADFAMMGPMHAHLGRDPVPAARMRARAPRVMAWLHETIDAATPTSAREAYVAATLEPLLAEIGSVFVPIQQATTAAVDEAGAATESGSELPRIFGVVDMPILGVASSRYLNTYSVWRHARTAQRYVGLSSEAKNRVGGWLDPAGITPLLRDPPSLVIEMRNNKLVKAA